MNNELLAGKQILLVEDSADSARLLRIFVEMSGGKLCWFEDPLEAITELENTDLDYDLILSDISLPNISGYEFCEKARTIAKYKNTPFIALSGHANLDGESESYGFSSHVLKPFDPDALINKLYSLTKH